MDIQSTIEATTSSLKELKSTGPDTAQVMEFEQAMSVGSGSLGGGFLNEIGQIKEQFNQAKHELRVQLASPGSDPSSLMQMQWSLMRITLQEELIAKTVGKMSQNVETLMKTQ